ncbi:MAG: HAD family hydrolase [Planctomycetota bacterium]
MSLLEGVSVVTWDVDGTLYELPAMAACLRRAALRRGLRAPLRVLREQRWLAQLRAAMEGVRRAGGELRHLGALPRPRAELAALEERWYGEAIRRAGPRPGVPETLADLRARGLRLVAVSDHPADYKLAALGLSGCFERVYVGEALGVLKPSPRLFEAVLEDLSLAPAALLHVGDRDDSDRPAATGAGCRFTLLAPGPVGPIG